MLERLDLAPEPWMTESQVRNGKKGAIQKAAFARLREQKRVVPLGRKGRSPVFGRCSEGQNAHSLALSMARRHLEKVEQDRAGRANRLLPIPLNTVKDKAPRKLPSAVRAALIDVLGTRKAEGTVFTLKVRGAEYFLFRSDLEAALGPAAVARKGAPAPAESRPTVHSKADTAARVHRAYRELRSETGLRNVLISEIVKRSGVRPDTLRSYLNEERLARRANASLGEPSAATDEQRAAALQIEGRPHIYIELYD